MPDLSHERERLYRLVDKWIEVQAEVENLDHDEDCNCGQIGPLNVRVISAAIVVGVNYEVVDSDGEEETMQAIFDICESRDGWAKAGLLQAAADSARRNII